jgi:hypothetical protein
VGKIREEKVDFCLLETLKVGLGPVRVGLGIDFCPICRV